MFIFLSIIMQSCEIIKVESKPDRKIGVSGNQRKYRGKCPQVETTVLTS